MKTYCAGMLSRHALAIAGTVTLIFMTSAYGQDSPPPDVQATVTASEVRSLAKRALEKPNSFLMDLPMAMISQKDEDGASVSIVTPYLWFGSEGTHGENPDARAGKFVVYRIGRVRKEFLGFPEGSSYLSVVEKQIQIAILKKFLERLFVQLDLDRGGLVRWSRKAEHLVEQSLVSLKTRQGVTPSSSAEFEMQFKVLLDNLDKEIETTATKKGIKMKRVDELTDVLEQFAALANVSMDNLMGFNIAEPGAPELPKVTIVTEPGQGSVEYMTDYFHQLCYEIKKSDAAFQRHCVWSSQTANPLRIGGLFWVRVRWSGNLWYAEKRQPEITESTTLTFRPDPK